MYTRCRKHQQYRSIVSKDKPYKNEHKTNSCVQHVRHIISSRQLDKLQATTSTAAINNSA